MATEAYPEVSRSAGAVVMPLKERGWTVLRAEVRHLYESLFGHAPSPNLIRLYLRPMISRMKAPERHVMHSNQVVVIDCEQEKHGFRVTRIADAFRIAARHLLHLRWVMVLIAVTYVYTYFAMPATPGNSPLEHPQGWWGWF